jgi:hypothetical protein
MFYEATLKTITINSLEPEIEKFRGKRINLIKGWRAEQGPYWGQQCYITVPYFGWIPEGELKDMRQISFPELKRKKTELEKQQNFIKDSSE